MFKLAEKRKHSESAKKQQPTENQKNNKHQNFSYKGSRFYI